MLTPSTTPNPWELCGLTFDLTLIICLQLIIPRAISEYELTALPPQSKPAATQQTEPLDLLFFPPRFPGARGDRRNSTSLIVLSSFTTSLGFISFFWKALLTLCQSFPSLDVSKSSENKGLRHTHTRHVQGRSSVRRLRAANPGPPAVTERSCPQHHRGEPRLALSPA